MTDCLPMTVSRIAWTSMKRCPEPVNPKRPTWRCKNAPTHIVTAEDGRSVVVCETHLAAMACPEAAA